MTTCTYDSGSATGCRPLCDQLATVVIEYDGYRGPLRSPVCDRHRGPTLGRIYPYTYRELPIEDSRARPDWRDMRPADFDASAELGALFDLEPGQVRADDGCGTGDLFDPS